MLKEQVSTEADITKALFSLSTEYGHKCQGFRLSPLEGGSALIYAMGWGTTAALHAGTMVAHAERGSDVWAVNPPRVGDMQLITDLMMPAVEVHKAAGVVSLLEKMKAEGIEETDIVVHSEGAIYATIAAVLAARNENTARVRSIIYVEPAGFVGKEPPRVLIGRFARQSLRNFLDAPGFYMEHRRSARGMLRRGVSLHEAKAIAHTDLSAMLALVHEYGIKIGVISGENDSVFPPDRIEKTLGALNIPHAYEKLPIRHNGMYIESNLIAEAVHRMLGELHVSEIA